MFRAPLGGINHRSHRVIIGDEIKRLAFFLQLDGRSHHPEIISEMQRAAGWMPDKIRMGEEASSGNDVIQDPSIEISFRSSQMKRRTIPLEMAECRI